MEKSKQALAAFAAVIALVASTLALAAPAQADTNLTLTGPTSATVGSAVTYTVTGGFGEGSVQLQDQNGQVWASIPLGVGAQSTQYLTFTVPTTGSPLNLTARSYDANYNPVGTSNTVTLTFASSGGTTTTISAPNNVQVGVAAKIIVYVTMQGGSTYSPQGQVIVRDQNGNVVSTLGLTAQGAGKSYAYWNWTAQAPGTYVLTAYYQGDSTAQPSTSQQDAINATPNGNTITLTAPGTLTVGVPVTLVATVYPASIQGSVGFTFNGAPISASIPIKNGQASISWTPTTAGQATLGANYTTNGGQTGSTSDKVTIVAGPVQKDVITLVQPGWGPWAAGGTYTLGNGSSFAFQASTLSGAAVTLSETGPCQVAGLTISVPTGSGQCNLVATSPGANGYAGVQNGYTVNLIPGVQTATVAAPQSGRLTKGRTYVLEAPGQQDTSAGQNISWKVAKGKPVCKLGYPKDGSVTIRLAKSGQCTVRGTAPGVPGQWNPYVVVRSYRG